VNTPEQFRSWLLTPVPLETDRGKLREVFEQYDHHAEKIITC
jgi:hypothetical protein